MPLGTPSSARLTLSRARPQPLASTTAAMPRLIAGSTHSHPVAMITQAATTTPSDTAASAAICRIRAADVEVAVAAAHEQQRGGAVDDDAERGDQDDGPARDRRRFLNALDRLDRDAADRDQQEAGIDQRRQDRRPPVAVGVLVASAACAPASSRAHASSRAITSEKL